MSAYEDIGYTKSDKGRNKDINAIIGRQTITSILEGLGDSVGPATDKTPEKAVPESLKAYKELYGVD